MQIPLPGRRGEEGASDLMKTPIRTGRETDSSFTPLHTITSWLEIELLEMLRLLCSITQGLPRNKMTPCNDMHLVRSDRPLGY